MNKADQELIWRGAAAKATENIPGGLGKYFQEEMRKSPTLREMMPHLETMAKGMYEMGFIAGAQFEANREEET